MGAFPLSGVRLRRRHGEPDDGPAVLEQHHEPGDIQPQKREPAVDVDQREADGGREREDVTPPRTVVPRLRREQAVLPPVVRSGAWRARRRTAPPGVAGAGRGKPGQPRAPSDVQGSGVLPRHVERTLGRRGVLRRAEQPSDVASRHGRGHQGQPGHVHLLLPGRLVPVGRSDPAPGECRRQCRQERHVHREPLHPTGRRRPERHVRLVQDTGPGQRVHRHRLDRHPARMHLRSHARPAGRCDREPTVPARGDQTELHTQPVGGER